MEDIIKTEEIIKLIIAVTIAVIGWIIAHYFTTKRDKQNKRREISLQHLISAYRILTNDISHRDQTKERQEKLEQVITDIQLFGNLKQITLTKQLIEGVVADKEFELDSLINSLRSDLREQLDLEYIEGNVKWLRFGELHKQ